MSSLIVSFDAFSDPYILKQTKALSEEYSAQYRVYSNTASLPHILEAIEKASEDGYTKLYLIIEDIDRLTEIENNLSSIKPFFEKIQLVPAYYPKIQRLLITKQKALKLKEASDAVSKVLLVGLLNANPPNKGLAGLIDLLLTYNISQDLPKLLPNLSKAGRIEIIPRLYLSPAKDSKQLPLPADYRASFLFPSKEFPGLYGPFGASNNKPAALKNRNAFVLGSPGVSLIESLQARIPLTACNHLVILGPTGTTVDSLQIPAGQYNLEDGGKIPILSFPEFEIDTPDNALAALGALIGKECATDSQNLKTEQPKALKSLVPADYTICNLIITLHLISVGKINPQERVGSNVDIIGKAEEYLINIWKAIPVGDREAIDDLARASGVKDILSVGADIVNLGKSVAGLTKKPETEDLKKLEKFKVKFDQMGYDIFKMVGHPKYEAFKAQIDI